MNLGRSYVISALASVVKCDWQTGITAHHVSPLEIHSEPQWLAELNSGYFELCSHHHRLSISWPFSVQLLCRRPTIAFNNAPPPRGGRTKHVSGKPQSHKAHARPNTDTRNDSK